MTTRTDYLKKFIRVEDNINTYTKDYPPRRRNKLLKDIEDGMKSLVKDTIEEEDKQEYNRLLKKLLDYYSDTKFEEAYKDKANKPRTPKIDAIPVKEEQVELEIEKSKEEALELPEVQRRMEKQEREAMGEEELETRAEMKEAKTRERNRKRRQRKRGSELLRELNEMTKKLEETKKEQDKTIKKLKKEKDAKMKAELEKEIKRLEMRNKEIREEIIREIDDEEERKEDVEERELDVEEMDLADIEDVDEEEIDLADNEDVDEEEIDLADFGDVDEEEIDLADIEDVTEEEMKDDDRREEAKVEEELTMEEIHNNIRKEEREKVMKEYNLVDPTIGSIDIPKERLGVEGKTIKILNDDIKYFINRFPDMLKVEADVYKKTNKKNKKALQEIHRRIQAKLSPDKKEEEGKKIGIILDADKFIDMKISEILATKTLEGLTPANLVDITKEPKSGEGRDVGSYTITKRAGRDVINNAPVYRSIPTTQPQKPERKGEINQNTIYKNTAMDKVDIARMEMRENPFIRKQMTKPLNIIL